MQDARQQFKKKGRLTGLAIVILAAVLLEVMAAIQYYYTRGILERNLEEQVLIMLRSSAMRLDGNLNATVAQASNQLWHAQQRIDNPDYMETMVRNLVKNGNGRVVGAGAAFLPYYYPEKGRWFEAYAHWKGDTVTVEQIGSAKHDYHNMNFFTQSITGDTLQWSLPYMDETGAGGEVITYSLPMRDPTGRTVGVLGIDLATGWINESLDQIKLHPSSFSLVLTKDGGVISAPADSACSKALAERIAAMIGDPQVRKEPKSAGRVMCFSFRDGQQGRRGRVYYAPKKYEPKWVLAKAVYDDEAFGELYRMQRAILLTSLAGLAVLVLIIRLFARNARKLQDTLLQQQRTERELQIANGIQQALLPLDMPSLRGTGEVDVEGRLIPAREVGGDLYNVFVRDGRLFFCIGDVSGKGVPAALIMAVTQTLFQSIAAEESNPARIMQRLNASACRNNRTEMFVTFFIGVLDLATGCLDYCNAGHERPLLDGRPLDVVPNMAIGVIDDFDYEPQTATIAPGSTLTLYTDGLTEALNAQHQLFGRKRVIQLVSSVGRKAPKEVVDTIITEVKHYADRTEQSDDLTLLTISYKPGAGSCS